MLKKDGIRQTLTLPKPDLKEAAWRKKIVPVAVVAAFAVIIWLIGRSPSGTETAQPNATQPLVTDQSLSNEKGLDLALKTISLTQGEGGFELWRLKAEWANMYKEGGLIFVEEPRLTYFMREEGKILYVQSKKGDIEQKSHIIRFIDEVQMTQDDKIMVGDLLVYNGTSKSMTFPQGGSFNATGVDGSADRFVWHIDRQHIEGIGSVKVFLEGNASAPEEADSVKPQETLEPEPQNHDNTPEAQL